VVHPGMDSAVACSEAAATNVEAMLAR
jgi:hypothetical protein